MFTEKTRNWLDIKYGIGTYIVITNKPTPFTSNEIIRATAKFIPHPVNKERAGLYIEPDDTNCKNCTFLVSRKGTCNPFDLYSTEDRDYALSVNNNITTYPNPFSDRITIKINKNNKYNGLRYWALSDMSGRKLLSNICLESAESETIDASSLPSGIYMLELGSQSNIIFQKMIKE